MNPVFTISQSFVWYTDLPSKDQTRESPVLFLKGNEWFFRIILELSSGYGWCYRLYMVLKKKHTDLRSIKVGYNVGFGVSSLYNGTFTVPVSSAIWSMEATSLQRSLPSDYITGNWMKLKFDFEDVPESLLKYSKELQDKSVQTPSYIDTNFLLEGVSQDLTTLFDEGPDHDVEFICKDETIKAHKNVLSCRSEVFASMLRTDMIEGKTGQVKILDMEGATFKQFLRYLYTGVLPELTADIALQFYEVADKYAVGALKKQCASFLMENLSPESACELLIVADRHNDPDFKKSIIEYLIKK